MSAYLVIIETEWGLSEFSKKLNALADNAKFETLRICSYEDFKDDKKLGSELKDDCVVYLGAGSNVPKIDEWHYEKYGCRIGFDGNKCVIRANNFELPYKDYNAFRRYCEQMKIDYDDVIVPPKNLFSEFYEFSKNLFGSDETKSTLRAQYTTLIYEFTEKWLIPFMQVNISDDDSFLSVTDMESKANNVVAASTAGAAAICAIPIPFADAPMLIAAQVTMLGSIATIFKVDIGRDGLKALVFAAIGVGGAVQIGRMAVANILKLIPGKGWLFGGIVSSTTASVLTLAMGKAFIEFCKRM